MTFIILLIRSPKAPYLPQVCSLKRLRIRLMATQLYWTRLLQILRSTPTILKGSDTNGLAGNLSCLVKWGAEIRFVIRTNKRVKLPFFTKMLPTRTCFSLLTMKLHPMNTLWNNSVLIPLITWPDLLMSAAHVPLMEHRICLCCPLFPIFLPNHFQPSCNQTPYFY